MKRNKYKAIAILMSAFLLALTSCVKKKQQLPKAEVKQEITQPEISPLDSVIRHDFKSANEMAFLLFKQVDKQKGRENFMISPFSLSNALVMLANGADGNTLKQIKDVLGAKDMNIDKVCKMYRDLDVYLKSIDTETSFANASSIWIDDKFKVKADFLKKSKEIFNAEVYNRPLATEKTMNDINSWCNRQTNGHIKDVLNNIPSPDSRMLLMNALYFNGKWSDPFSKENTKEEFFRNYDGSKSKVNMMYKFEYMKASVCDKFDIVEFPYGKRDFSMVVILPHKGQNIDICLKNLSSKQVNKIDSNSDFYYVSVHMPQLELKDETDFNRTLMALGMTDAFSEKNANLSKISDDLYVSAIKQKTSIKVNEEGTEATAVTHEIIMAKDADAPKPKVLVFNMDRPFVYLIREKITGTILFMGKVRKL